MPVGEDMIELVMLIGKYVLVSTLIVPAHVERESVLSRKVVASTFMV